MTTYFNRTHTVNISCSVLSRFALSAFLGLSLWNGPCQAAVEPSKVSSDASWVLYADFNAIRSTALGKELIETIRKEQADKTGGLLGINAPKVLEMIGSVTAFGTATGSKEDLENGSLLIQGTPDLKKIAEAFLIQQSVDKPEAVTELKEFPYPAYGVLDKSPKATSGAQVVIAFPPEPVILVSKSKAHLAKTLEVFRGNAESLAKTPNAPLSSLLKDAGDVSLLGATTLIPSSIGSKDKPSRILQLASSGMFALGESGPNTVARLVLIASSDETAGKMLKIVQGMTAMLSLAESSDKQLTEFLNSVQVDKDKQTVSLKLAYPSERVLQIFKNIQQVKHAKSENAKSDKSKKEGVNVSISVTPGQEEKPKAAEAAQTQGTGK